MGAAPILDFRGLRQSRAQGHGELVPPHPCRVGGWANHHGHYGTGFAVFSCTQQPKNLHLKPAYFLQYLSIQDISLQSQSQ